MSFNEFSFFVLFLLTFFIYYLPPLREAQVIVLIISSLIFYSWNSPQLLILLLLSILINGVTSFRVAYIKRNKFFWAFIGVLSNLFILIFFKYGALLSDSLTNLANNSNNELATALLTLPLPLGISFYTFEGISLLLDVTRGKSNQQAMLLVDKNLNRHLIKTSFFISFFPHLIAGPILKADNFYPQIKPKYFCDIPWNLVFRSLVVGYFLKMVIADNLKDYTIWLAFPYNQSLNLASGIVLLFGYSMQIFADFAGYSLIAIGTASALGYYLPQNFNFPYISRSLSEFWKRWHISLSTWLKDYLYISLGGNRKGKLRTYLNLLIVMILGGLWHGAAWSYAVWGGYHGIGLVVERFFSEKFNDNKLLTKWQKIVSDIIRTILVFSFVSTGWLLFRIPDFKQVVDLVSSMINNTSLSLIRPLTDPVICFSIPVVIYHLVHLPALQENTSSYSQRGNTKILGICRDIALGVMLVMIVLNSGNSSEFIYFQF